MTGQYEIHLKGHLDPDWEAWFEGFTLHHRPDGTTVLNGLIDDQPALHGLLARISQLGLTLLKVEQIEEETGDE